MTNSRNRRLFPLLLQALAVVVVAALFVSLGLWQWERAQRHQELDAQLDQIAMMAPTEINKVHSPVQPLDGEVANRLVIATGRYLGFFDAPEQDGGTYQVGLLEVEGSKPRAAILVARQLGSISENSLPASNVEILARMLPSQREDRFGGPASDGQLRRIDSALLVEWLDDPTLALYDGFLLLREESIDSAASALVPIPDQIAEPTIPGYYWQHISYVVIWFLMAALVLYLPLYQRRRNRLLSIDALAREHEDGKHEDGKHEDGKHEKGVKR